MQWSCSVLCLAGQNTQNSKRSLAAIGLTDAPANQEQETTEEYGQTILEVERAGKSSHVDVPANAESASSENQVR